MTTLQPHANTKGVKRSVASSLDLTDAPELPWYMLMWNQIDEDKSDNSYKTHNNMKSRCHSTNTFGTYQGKDRISKSYTGQERKAGMLLHH